MCIYVISDMYYSGRVQRHGRITRNSTGSNSSIHEDERPAMIEDNEEKQPPPVSMMKILKKNMPEWPYILIGSLGSIVMGFAMPIFGILFGDILGVSN
jgi:hypothetical protein